MTILKKQFQPQYNLEDSTQKFLDKTKKQN